MSEKVRVYIAEVPEPEFSELKERLGETVEKGRYVWIPVETFKAIQETNLAKYVLQQIND